MEKIAVPSNESSKVAKAAAEKEVETKNREKAPEQIPQIQFKFDEGRYSSLPVIQSKLTIGQLNDKDEQEAERVADKIMTMPEPVGIQRSCASCTTDELQTKPLFQAITPFLQKQVEEPSYALRSTEPIGKVDKASEDEESSFTEAAEDEEGSFQAKMNNDSSQTATPSIENSINQSKGQGSPLPDNIRSFMEDRFGADFCDVKVHTDSDSVQLNKQLNSQAFTKGSDIYFNEGKYDPGSSSGKHLLAHELTHTVQQGYVSTLLQRQPKPAPNPCQQGINDTVRLALPNLQEAIKQLTTYESGQKGVEAGGPTTPEIERVGGALEYNFHTRDSGYAKLIRERIQIMESRLRSLNNLTLRCASAGDTHCKLKTFSQQTAAYAQLNLVVFCDVGTPGKRPVATFIHELAHAVVPNVGTLTPIKSQADTPSDRAYEHQRIYHYLSTEEALDNADSYNLLIGHLVAKKIIPAKVPYSDTLEKKCPDQTLINSAVARAEHWNFMAQRWLEAAVEFLGSNAVLAPADQARITPYFTGTTKADLEVLSSSYQSIVESFRNGINVRCTVNRHSCKSNILGTGRRHAVTDVNVTAAYSRSDEFYINLCPDWFKAGEEDRIRSIYALFIVSRPNHMINNPSQKILIQRNHAYDYVDLAHDLYAYLQPPPKASSLIEHQLADFSIRLQKIETELKKIDRQLKALGVKIDQLQKDLEKIRKNLHSTGIQPKLEWFDKSEYTHADALNSLATQIIAKGISGAQFEISRCRKEGITNIVMQQRRVFAAIITATRQDLIKMNNMEHPGCHKVSEILVHICKKVNIRAEYKLSPNPPHHGYPYLPDAKIGLKHGDDVYSRGILRSASAEQLILSEAKIKQYYEEELKWKEKTRMKLIKLEEKRATAEMISLQQAIIATVPKTYLKVKFFKFINNDPENIRKRIGAFHTTRISVKDILNHYLSLPATVWSYATVRGKPSKEEMKRIGKYMLSYLSYLSKRIPDARYQSDHKPGTYDEVISWMAVQLTDRLRDKAIQEIRSTSPPGIPSEKILHGL